MIADPFAPFAACHFRLKPASESWEHEGAARLRRAVFCDEQKIFEGEDRDEIDARAICLVALSNMSLLSDEVVGTVRIHEAQPRIWYGSRLAVDPRYRRIGAVGAALIRLAVSSASAAGCDCFLAHVQAQNELMFRRLNWTRRREITLHDRPHVLMEADLAAYPPLVDRSHGFYALAKKVAA